MDSRSLAATVLLAGVAVLGGALLFQYVGGLPPCDLCIWQRWPWGIAIALGVVALAVPPLRRASGRALPAAVALLFVAGAAIAAYHAGVEQHWIAGPATCTGPVGAATNFADFARMIEQRPVVRCDDIPWSLFGISLAGFNALISAAIAALALWTLTHFRPERPAR
ncbi:MAG: disulfide bond formation protein B [Alphaproteobacteria bacterium]